MTSFCQKFLLVVCTRSFKFVFGNDHIERAFDGQPAGEEESMRVLGGV